MNPSRYRKVQLVELLKKRQLPTHGSKGEMIARLQEADPENLWLHEYESAEADGVARLDIGDQESSHVPQARVRQDDGVPDANAMNPSRYRKVQLVELLKKRQLPTHGSKGEMIARLQEADPENLWLHEYESAEADGVARLDIGDQESSHVPQARVRQDDGVPDA
ncbi:hypothetical protein DMN91_002690 [Ooceraea biroi]|uniref:SAP domain-containing protein n=1 Tax=Ooceraea biroi TaxID=2015173 RepID=A0A3L8DVZ6_OOCBI|nr:hypothetical protein DMN91_002690 [Ooceraea biroi]